MFFSNLFTLQGFVARGECLVQDVSAGLVVAAALDPQPGERVLDACAAPGGKTMFCTSRMQGKVRSLFLCRDDGMLGSLHAMLSIQAINFISSVAGHPASLDTARLQALTRQDSCHLCICFAGSLDCT